MASLAVLVALLLVPTASTARDTGRTARSVTATAPAGAVERGDTVRLSGRVTRTPRGGLVRLQRLSAGRWRTVATTRTTTARGAWSRLVRANAVGTLRFRAVAPATRRLRAATSRVVRVRVVAPGPSVEPGQVRRVTAGADEVVVSDDGATLAVVTEAALLPADDNGVGDVYLVSALDGSAHLVSAHPDGSVSAYASAGVDVSADASAVVFETRAALLPDDTNGTGDVYVWRRGDGGTLAVVSQAGTAQSDGTSGSASISGNGRFVAFASTATTLVDAAGTPSAEVYVRDLQRAGADGVTLISRKHGATAPTYAGSTSGRPSVASVGSGVSVAFESMAGLTTGTPTPAPQVFLSEVDGAFVTTTLVSTTPTGAPGAGASTQPDLSRDRDHVAFTSTARDLVAGQVDEEETLDVFVRDTSAPAATAMVLVSGRRTSSTVAAGASYEPSLSSDGARVAFTSAATDLRQTPLVGPGAGRNQVYRRSVAGPVMVLASRSHRGGAGAGQSAAPAMTPDGERVAFISTAPDLVPAAPDGPGTYLFTAPAL